MLQNRSMPQATVIPELAYPDVTAAAVWLCAVFGFSVRIRIADHRVQLNVGGGAIVLTQGEPAVTGHSLMIRVADANALHARLVARDVRVLQPPVDHAYGERQFTVEDFVGRRWKFSQSIADVAPETWGGTPG